MSDFFNLTIFDHIVDSPAGFVVDRMHRLDSTFSYHSSSGDCYLPYPLSQEAPYHCRIFASRNNLVNLYVATPPCQERREVRDLNVTWSPGCSYCKVNRSVLFPIPIPGARLSLKLRSRLARPMAISAGARLMKYQRSALNCLGFCRLPAETYF